MSVSDCQLLNACGTSYGIAPDGSFSQNQPYYGQVGWTAQPAAIVGGQYDSDAAVVGAVDGATIVAFRGTEELVGDPIQWGQVFDWLSNDFLGLPPIAFPGQSSWGNVHAGWWDSVDKLWGQLTAQNIDFTQPVYFTGHSKGGPMASLAAMRAKAEGTDVSNLNIVTFASPHPGDTTFAKQYATTFPDAYGYANWLDVVPLLPLSKAVIGIVELFGGVTGLAKGVLDLMKTWDYQQAGLRKYYDAGTFKFQDTDGSNELTALDDIKNAVEGASSELAGLEAIAQHHYYGCPNSDGNAGGYTEAACADSYKSYCPAS